MRQGQLGQTLTVPGSPAEPISPPAHAHPHALSRRGFLGSAAGAAGAVMGAGLLMPVAGMASGSPPLPKPIPGGFTINGITFHVNGFALGAENSSITDFKGFLGVAQVQGNGTATYPDGSTHTLLYDTDMRFMQGTYVARDGSVRQGTFGFI